MSKIFFIANAPAAVRSTDSVDDEMITCQAAVYSADRGLHPKPSEKRHRVYEKVIRKRKKRKSCIVLFPSIKSEVLQKTGVVTQGTYNKLIRLFTPLFIELQNGYSIADFL